MLHIFELISIRQLALTKMPLNTKEILFFCQFLSDCARSSVLLSKHMLNKKSPCILPYKDESIVVPPKFKVKDNQFYLDSLNLRLTLAHGIAFHYPSPDCSSMSQLKPLPAKVALS